MGWKQREDEDLDECLPGTTYSQLICMLSKWFNSSTVKAPWKKSKNISITAPPQKKISLRILLIIDKNL